MDNLVSESAEAQIDGLDFSLSTTSMAVTSRRFINVFPSGSNVYNATSGNKVIRFNISADDNQFLDLVQFVCSPFLKIKMEMLIIIYDLLVVCIPSFLAILAM